MFTPSISVIVHNFNLVGTVFSPHKTDAPLVINADTVLPLPAAFERLQHIARRNSQAAQLGGRMDLQQLAPRHPFDVPEPADGQALKQAFGVGTEERANHVAILV